jgi:hypothetical protein
MSKIFEDPKSASYNDGIVAIVFKSGETLTFPVKGNPRLEGRSDAELNDIELSPFGIHWSKLDEDLSFEGILKGDYGQKSG